MVQFRVLVYKTSDSISDTLVRIRIRLRILLFSSVNDKHPDANKNSFAY